MDWLTALRHWNASHGGRYTIPRKGTPEYDEVRALMSGSGARQAGYVKLLYAKKVNKKKPSDYDFDEKHRPKVRPKKSAKKFIPAKVTEASPFLQKKFGVPFISHDERLEQRETEAVAEELKQAAKVLPLATAKEKAERAAAAAAPKADIRDFFKPARLPLLRPQKGGACWWDRDLQEF